jgi:hypothetical protein
MHVYFWQCLASWRSSGDHGCFGWRAAVSTSIFGIQTHAIAISFPGSTSSTGGVRVKVIDVGAAAVSSTTDFLLPANWVEKIIVNPGQRASIISNDAGVPSISIVELTK